MTRAVKMWLIGGWILVLLLAGVWFHMDYEHGPVACERELREAFAAGQTLANKPRECNGVDQETLKRIVGEITFEAVTDTIEQSLNDAFESLSNE